MIGEFDDLGVADGFRGGPPWDRPALARLLVAAGDLAAGARGWLRTFDVNRSSRPTRLRRRRRRLLRGGRVVTPRATAGG